jgi:hypothetical protein
MDVFGMGIQNIRHKSNTDGFARKYRGLRLEMDDVGMGDWTIVLLIVFLFLLFLLNQPLVINII